MIVLGVDENGMGPLLGPMVATAVSLDMEEYDARKLRKKARRFGIDDSKKTAAFGRMAASESLALALAAEASGTEARNVDEFFAAVAIEGVQPLRSSCPESTAGQCWGATIELPAFGGAIEEGRRMLAKLDRAGVRVLRTRTSIACARSLNADFELGLSKLAVDLRMFEQLILDARRALAVPLSAYCGMVGGMRNYRQYFHALEIDEATSVEDEASMSYNVRDVGNVRFEIDADSNHTPVSIASMVGKYVRELWMERQNRFYAAHDEALPRHSGYRDPVTKRFIRESEPLRHRLSISPPCFQRTR